MTMENKNPEYSPWYDVEEESNFDIKGLIIKMLANWYWFAITIFVCLTVAYLINRYSAKSYSVSASVLVRDDDNAKGLVGAEQLINGLKLTRNTKSIQNEIGILKSYTLARKTIDALEEFEVTYVGVGRRRIAEGELYKNSPYKVLIDSGANNRLGYPVDISILNEYEYRLVIDDGMGIDQKMRFGERFTSAEFDFTVVLRNGFDPQFVGQNHYFYINNENSLANVYRAKVSIDVNDKKGSLITLSSTGPVALQEADYINKLMEVYIQRGLEEKNLIATNTVGFIDKQLVEMVDSLRKAEQSLQEFRTQNRVVDITSEGRMLFDRLKSVQNQQAEFELRGRYYAYLKDYLEKREDLNSLVAPSAMGVEDQQLTYFLNEINQTYIEKENLRTTVKDGTLSSMTTLDVKMENLRSALSEKVKSLIETNKIALEEAQMKLAKIEKEVRQLPVNERMLIGFERNFGLINKMYTYLQEKRAEAAIAQASNIADNRVLDYAMAENAAQIKPKKSMNYLIAFVLGCGIPFMVIVIMGFLNNKIVDISVISKETKVPVIGTIGHNKYEGEIPVSLKPRSTLAESFRGLRTNLQFLLREPGRKIITITSTVVGEGKTFIATNLAAIIAAAEKKVLIMGLDLRKPKMQRNFGYNENVGISTYLIGQNSITDIVFESGIKNLYFAPSGAIPPNPSELIGSKKMEELINWARQNFDFIVIDSPPIAVVSDTFLLSQYSDTMLYVVRYDYSDKEVLSLVNDLYSHQEIKNLAIVVNDFQIKRGYGYSSGYSYSYGYSYGYGNRYGYGYGSKKKGQGYYSDDDDEQNISWRDKIRRLF